MHSSPFPPSPHQEVQLELTITDTFSSGLVDVIITNLTQTVGGMAEEETYMGNFGVVNFTFGITIHCVGTFSCGPDCESMCVPQNDSGGHFSCDESKCMVCLPGFQNETNNCIDCVPRPGCCEFHLSTASLVTYPWEGRGVELQASAVLWLIYLIQFELSEH